MKEFFHDMSLEVLDNKETKRWYIFITKTGLMNSHALVKQRLLMTYHQIGQEKEKRDIEDDDEKGTDELIK
jgi:hypothetical protein